ncbi:SDR family NAD(P)-dependent oxidoreductase [Halieaceae bacterium IMCC14734]|uniref:SDR family NAD(P)-dependent oxidoreductase n=1 Tax=Candidatus Litorirhabdus singularis TaxID=2518993 RepID=A0ABT3THZ1_9GAMM|nr:SDR family NAD(P)-dependent oxidoreductase [Candidatus Litorirhabdus singularis]MCX2981940.1 SDR family NAD(P)-dependent oxidoreductase [Candidatus Litorirhabdus singularis]
MQDLTGKTAVITGAASGIGFALAQVFAEQGMQLVLADIETDALEKRVTELRSQGAAVLGVVTDVGDDASVAALASAAAETYGNVHLLCNNAGVYTGGLLWEQTEADFEWVMRVNQWGIIHGIRHFVPAMIEHGQDCHIVNTASMAGLCTLPIAGIYHMTKHAALALSECLYHDLALSAPQIGVSCLCPELADTEIARARRNRPATLAEENQTAMHEFAHAAISDATSQSKPPRVLAERVLQGVLERQFYLLPPADDPWIKTAHKRLDDVHAARNPEFLAPEI